MWNQPMQQMPQFVDDRVFVNDQAEAEAYMLFPGNVIHLWHRTENICYERRKDMNGREYPMLILRYTSEKVRTKEEMYEERIRVLEELVQKMNAKEVSENE